MIDERADLTLIDEVARLRPETPEYLAAGRAVVSTPITDVVHPYADEGLVHSAATPEEFVAAAIGALTESRETGRLQRVDDFLAGSGTTCTAPSSTGT